MLMYGSKSIIKFADGTTVIGLITDNDESDYRAEYFAAWCSVSNLLINASKTRKENRERHMISSVSMAWLWNVSPASSSWRCTSQRTCAGQSTPRGWSWRPISASSSGGHWESTTSGMETDRKALQRAVKPPNTSQGLHQSCLYCSYSPLCPTYISITHCIVFIVHL